MTEAGVWAVPLGCIQVAARAALRTACWRKGVARREVCLANQCACVAAITEVLRKARVGERLAKVNTVIDDTVRQWQLPGQY
jgi:hypothetical protein